MLAVAWITALATTIAASGSPALLAKRDVKTVLAHVIVGNTYNYDIQRWTSDIQLASSKSIDVFAMNVGRDYWQPDRVKLAYDAALSSVPGFKLMLSFDMTEFPCTSTSDGQYLIDTFLAIVKNHPSRYLYDSKMALTTFGGQWCTFGQLDPSTGWQWFLASAGMPIYFIPNFHVDVAELSTTWSWLDGYKLWNAWPLTRQDKTQWADDAWYLQHTRSGQGYLTMVSPWFFIHRSGGGGNSRYYRGDNFMYTDRWRQLIQNRNSLPFVEIGSWNDYGESHYIGPLNGSIPAGTSYVGNTTDHYAWLDLTKHYALWFKYGIEPKIDQERVYMWARSQPKDASICNTDGIGVVQNANWAEELLYVSMFMTAPGQAHCFSGTSNTGIKDLMAGVNEFSIPLSEGPVGCLLVRNGTAVLDYQPSDFRFSRSPSTCNMNAWTGTSVV
ncbi:alpha-1,3-glucanase [Ceratobasidium sp. AG-Ba]|nr:alpha-1,3-glucanase [Ceratobasidium sp. AG-Ba]